MFIRGNEFNMLSQYTLLVTEKISKTFIVQVFRGCACWFKLFERQQRTV